MGNYLNIGNAGFQSVKKGLYVDKTGMISFINNTLGTMDKLTCVSRPRRFGKSFAAKMLCAYYDKSCNSEELFAGLDIAEVDSYKKHLNKYDVIYLDITLFIAGAADIKNVVSDLQKKVIAELRETYPEVKKEETLYETLSAVTDATGNKFIIIIDEWDALFREAKYDTQLQKEYIQLLRSLFKSSLTDKMIEAAYITGILPIKKYGTQSALTDFREYTMLQPKKLAEYVGFTEQEVIRLCAQHDMDFYEMKRWYDGYSFSRQKSIYSPNSVVEAIKSEEFGNYWTETETYESLKLYIDMDYQGLKETIVQMLGNMKCEIDIGTFQNDMTNIKNRDDVLTLLVHLGYLAYDSVEKKVFIPNEEVRREFIRAVKASRYEEIIRLIQDSEQLLSATLSLDETYVAQAVAAAHRNAVSPMFYNNEQALRSVIRFAYISCIGEYTEIQELPSGQGYADIVYLPKRGSDKPVLIIELKWNKSAEGAIQQIKDRHYPEVLQNFGNEIMLVGINYDATTKEHSCRIEKWQV